MHKAVGKCVPAFGDSDELDIRYEIRFHSLNGLPELEQGKSVLIVWRQAWGAANKKKGRTTPKAVEGPTVTWLGRREGKVSFTTTIKRRHLRTTAKSQSRKKLRLYVVEPHGAGFRKLYKGKLALGEYADEVVCAHVGLVLHPCLKYYWNSNPVLQMYISSKWVGEEVKEFRTMSRKASAFLEFDFISDHIDQCMKKSLKETQSEISTISHKCKTLKRKCRKQQTALDEALEKLQHKESELAELQQREGGQSTRSLISWEWDDGSGTVPTQEDQECMVGQDAGAGALSMIPTETKCQTICGHPPCPTQVSAPTFLAFLSITWAYRNVYKCALEFLLCYLLGAVQLHPTGK